MAYNTIQELKNPIPGKNSIPIFIHFFRMNFNSSVSEQESWADAANRIIQKSQTERAKSCQLRVDAETLVNRVAQEMWDAWSNTNNALANRNSEMLEAKSKLQQHLNKERP